MNAVSLAFPLQTILIGVSVGTGVGMNALISRSLGEKNFDRADEAANTGIFLFLCSAILFGVIGLVIPGPYYRILTDNSRIISYGSAYMHICLGCALAAEPERTEIDVQALHVAPALPKPTGGGVDPAAAVQRKLERDG